MNEIRRDLRIRAATKNSNQNSPLGQEKMKKLRSERNLVRHNVHSPILLCPRAHRELPIEEVRKIHYAN